MGHAQKPIISAPPEPWHQAWAALPAYTPSEKNISLLTEQQKASAICAAKGYTNKESAKALNISHLTVGEYLKQAYKKLGVSTRGELARAIVASDPSLLPIDKALQDRITQYQTLSTSEKKVFLWVGFFDKEGIAEKIHLSKSTIDDHLKHIYKAFKVNNYAELNILWIALKMEAERLNTNTLTETSLNSSPVNIEPETHTTQPTTTIHSATRTAMPDSAPGCSTGNFVSRFNQSPRDATRFR